MKKEEYLNKLEPFIYSRIEGHVLEEYESKPELTYNRFDLAFKLFYLKFIDEDDSGFSKNIYKEHIRAFTRGTFQEYGNDEKCGFDVYEKTARELFNDIQRNGFDSTKSVVPLAKDGSILNGAHRTAISFFLNQKVNFIETGLEPLVFDYKFFISRGVSQSVMDAAANTFISHDANTYIAFIWPTAGKIKPQLEELFPKIVYQKDVILNSNGAHNLLSQLYKGEKWLGSVEDNFKGGKSKLNECFKSFSPIRVVAFQADSLEQVLDIKENFRETLNMGKHSIHITDNHEESIRSYQMVFNENSVHFLNYAKPNKFMSTFCHLSKVNNFISKNNIAPNDVLFDSSITLSTYGVREAADVDYLINTSLSVPVKIEGVDDHEEVLAHYKISLNELIYDPNNFYYFEGLKFISLNNLFSMKQSRGEKKDLNDCEMIQSLLKNNKIQFKLHQLKQKFENL